MRGPFENALANAKLAILSLLIALGVSVILNISLGIGLATAPKKVMVYQENCDGSTTVIDPNIVSPVRIQNFVSQQWSTLNAWPNNGEDDWIKNLNDQKANFTPNFINQYKHVIDDLKEAGYLRNYIMVTIPLQSDPTLSVKKIDGGWAVKATFISRFYFNPYGDEVKFNKQDAQKLRAEQTFEQTIVFKVVQYPNQSGLALDGIINAKTQFDQDNKETENKTGAKQ